MRRWVRHAADWYLRGSVAIGIAVAVLGTVGIGVAMILGIRFEVPSHLGDVLLGGIIVWTGILMGLLLLDDAVNGVF